MRLSNLQVCALGLSLAVTMACGGSEPSNKSAEPTSPAGATSGMKVDESKAGNVTGMVVLEGTAPKNEPIKMAADPVCAQQANGPQAQETYTVGSDGTSLGNVFVYVKDGLGNSAVDIPRAPAKTDQKECRYPRHAFGMRAGQAREIKNSDPTLHNSHATPKGNAEFNVGQPVQGMTNTHTFPTKEVMVP